MVMVVLLVMLVLFLKSIQDFLKQKMLNFQQVLLLTGENTLRIIHPISLVVELLQDFQQLDIAVVTLSKQIKDGIKMQMELSSVELVQRTIRLSTVKITREI